MRHDQERSTFFFDPVACNAHSADLKLQVCRAVCGDHLPSKSYLTAESLVAAIKSLYFAWIFLKVTCFFKYIRPNNAVPKFLIRLA